MKLKNVVILGSTGSIGINCLKVIKRYPKKFKVVGLTAYSNFRLLEKQIKEFSPSYAAVDTKGVAYLKRNISSRRIQIFDIKSGLDQLVSLKSVDIVVIGMRGSVALSPFLSAVRAGKIVAPANKEALVIAGDIIMREARRHGVKIIPIDSEQSAIFQCIDGRNRDELKRVWLTASGGSLREHSHSVD